MPKPIFIKILGIATKVIIFPFFYVGTHFMIFVSTALIFNSFDENYWEVIEGIAIGTFIFAPLMLVVLLPVSVIILLLFKKKRLLINDRFLAIFGVALAVINMLLIYTPIGQGIMWFVGMLFGI
ncbi:hypothetical protein KKF55_01055 [Patescibacteria group bacterium]|nr:hypothetical protein [Patescibacteria group bacterium]